MLSYLRDIWHGVSTTAKGMRLTSLFSVSVHQRFELPTYLIG